MKNAIQNFTFMIDFRLRGIEIFCCFRIIFQQSATKGYYPACQIVNRKNNPARKAVSEPFIAPDCNAGFFKKLKLISLFQSRISKGCLSIGGITKFKFLQNIIPEPSFTEITEP